MSRSELASLCAAKVDAEEVVELTRALVRIRSVVEAGSPGSDEGEVARYIAGVLDRWGFEVTVEEVEPGRPNVIADWQGSRFVPGRDRTLMFEGHTDVVTEGDPEDWRVSPFSASLTGGRIYGRGSADMKGGLAAAMVAARTVARHAPDLPGRIRMGIVVDEEGMMLGIKHFIDRGWAAEVDGAIVCEPEENELCLHQKGAIRIGVVIQGEMAHGAMPYAGVNPVPALATFISALGALQGREQSRLGEHPFLGLPWLTPTVVRAPATGEGQLNVMPGSAYLALDIRTVPGQEHVAVRHAVDELARRTEGGHPGVTVSCELIEERPWTETSADDPLVAALVRAHRLVAGEEPRFGGVPGATDGTFLKARAGVPIVTVGPGGRTIPHQRDEYVEVTELVAAARLYAAAAVEYLQGQPDPPASGSE